MSSSLIVLLVVGLVVLDDDRHPVDRAGLVRRLVGVERRPFFPGEEGRFVVALVEVGGVDVVAQRDRCVLAAAELVIA